MSLASACAALIYLQGAGAALFFAGATLFFADADCFASTVASLWSGTGSLAGATLFFSDADCFASTVALAVLSGGKNVFELSGADAGSSCSDSESDWC